MFRNFCRDRGASRSLLAPRTQRVVVGVFEATRYDFEGADRCDDTFAGSHGGARQVR